MKNPEFLKRWQKTHIQEIPNSTCVGHLNLQTMAPDELYLLLNEFAKWNFNFNAAVFQHRLVSTRVINWGTSGARLPIW